jgi:hypothetical protein
MSRYSGVYLIIGFNGHGPWSILVVERVNRIEWELNMRVSSRAAGRDSSWTTVFVWVIGAVLFGGLAGEGHHRGGA